MYPSISISQENRERKYEGQMTFQNIQQGVWSMNLVRRELATEDLRSVSRKVGLKDARAVPEDLDVLQLQLPTLSPSPVDRRGKYVADLAAVELGIEAFVDPAVYFIVIYIFPCDLIKKHIDDTFLYSFVHLRELNGEMNPRLNSDVEGKESYDHSARLKKLWIRRTVRRQEQNAFVVF